jgi:hypothetical protein
MQKRKYLSIGLALIAASVTLNAQQSAVPSATITSVPTLLAQGGTQKIEAPVKDNSGPVFAFETFGVVETPDLDHERSGVGIGATINITDYLGLSVEGYSFGKSGVFVDRAGASLRYNIVTKSKSRPYVFAGAWHDFERNQNGGHLGVGVQHQFAKFFTPFVEIRMHKPLDGGDTSPTAIARAGLSVGF